MRKQSRRRSDVLARSQHSIPTDFDLTMQAIELALVFAIGNEFFRNRDKVSRTSARHTLQLTEQCGSMTADPTDRARPKPALSPTWSIGFIPADLARVKCKSARDRLPPTSARKKADLGQARDRRAVHEFQFHE
jgi:hypothetical protein